MRPTTPTGPSARSRSDARSLRIISGRLRRSTPRTSTASLGRQSQSTSMSPLRLQGAMSCRPAKRAIYPQRNPAERRHRPMAKNANGEGSIYKWMKDGKQSGYKGAISYVDDQDKTRRYVAYGRTRADVRTKLDKAHDRLLAGAPVRDAKQTVGDWLALWRVTALAASDRKASTKALYANLSCGHL